MDKWPDFMLDLETGGKRPGCVVLTIGLVGFDYVADDVGEPFYCSLNLHEQMRAGLHIDPGTMQWWTEQSTGAQSALIAAVANDYPLHQNITGMLDFLADQAGIYKYRVWGNGAGFDQPILREVMRVAAMEAPWPFYNEKCHRTLKDMPKLLGGKAPDMPGNKAAHRADADAVWQARQAVTCLRHMAGMPLSRYATQPLPPETESAPGAAEVVGMNTSATGYPAQYNPRLDIPPSADAWEHEEQRHSEGTDGLVQ